MDRPRGHAGAALLARTRASSPSRSSSTSGQRPGQSIAQNARDVVFCAIEIAWGDGSALGTALDEALFGADGLVRSKAFG